MYTTHHYTTTPLHDIGTKTGEDVEDFTDSLKWVITPVVSNPLDAIRDGGDGGGAEGVPPLRPGSGGVAGAAGTKSVVR